LIDRHSSKEVAMKRASSQHRILVAFAGIVMSMPANASEQLVRDKACLSCHAVDKKAVGPSFNEIAAKYKSRKDAQDYMAQRIRSGSSGVWGNVPMPPTAVSEGEAKTLAKWIAGL
jgi:cytochrome c